jgi:hypothetical protein
MNCPACDSDRVFHSRARTLSDRAVKRLLPMTFYRCHACGWRRARWQKLSGRKIAMHTLSVVGYMGSVAVVGAVLAGALFLVLTFLGVPMPWAK